LLLLGREPDEGGMESYMHRVISREMSVQDVQVLSLLALLVQKKKY
jgi:hypothetical protein